VIEITNLTKRFGAVQAVTDVSFAAPAGQVTGFLGPNGAGKTTTLRILLGLARPDEGTAVIDGKRYVDLPSPRRTVGAVFDQAGLHPGRSARNHLRVIARAAGISPGRVDKVLEFVDLTRAAGRRVGGFSHGMRQRVALAGALLGDPAVLVLDEPATGLDPAGMAWLRELLRQWAAQGRTVLFSSHALAEVETVADRLVIINRGRIVRQGRTSELTATEQGVLVRTADRTRFGEIAAREGWQVNGDGDGRLVIHGTDPVEVGRVAAREGVALTELSTAATRRLEDLFLELTRAEA